MSSRASQSRKTKVLLHGPDPSAAYRTGGVATYVRYLRQMLERQGIKVAEIYIDPSLGQSLPKALRLPLGILGAMLRTTTEAPSAETVMHVNTSLYARTVFRDLPVVWCAYRRGIPIYLQIHGGRLAKATRRCPFGWLWKKCFQMADIITVFPGPQYAEFERAGFADRLEPIYNFTPSTEVVVDTTGPARFVFLGSLCRNKGVDRLLSVFLRLCDAGCEDASLTIIGDGPLFEPLRTKARDSRHRARVQLVGHQTGDQLRTSLAEANIFVLPSLAEGFPLSFVECAEMGMCCLVTRNSAVPHVFDEGRMFIPLEPGDDEMLFDVMMEVAHDPERRRRLGDAVRRRVYECCIAEAAAERYRRQYQQLCSSAATSHGKEANS